ncbi:MAG TPA: iron-sulfur cluster assembly scaffold protein [Thermodesulfobacteriota bacterium]|nr:iron-sulfur cluster assembly scaffold protein [Thermodesulfobacteriota bacterium]
MEPDQYEFILDHYKNPRNYGTIEGADASYEEGIPSCGDKVRIDVRLGDGTIEDVKFTGTGCAISQASVSILTENVRGRTVDEIMSLRDEDVLETLGKPISPVRFKCALLGMKVLKKALLTLKGSKTE